MFEYRHRRLVLSVPVLLAPGADSPQWNGMLRRGFPNETPLSTLRYEVIRLWQLPVEQLLAGGLGTVALAPINDVTTGDVRRAIGRVKERLAGPGTSRRAADVWAATYVLLGLRYSEEFAHALFQEVLGMEQSATYQGIVRRARAEEARHFLLRLGEKKFGSPDAATRTAIEGISDVAEREDLGERLLNADAWHELLPPPRARRRRKSGPRDEAGGSPQGSTDDPPRRPARTRMPPRDVRLSRGAVRGKARGRVR